MESILNYLNQLHGDTITHDEYSELGRRIAAYELNNDPSETIPSERTDRVQNAILAIWSHEKVFTRDDFEQCRRLLNGDVSPDGTSLPRPTLRDFSKARDARPNDGLDEILDEMFAIIDASVTQETTQPVDQEEIIEEAETIWENFLKGEPITTDDLLTLQLSGML